MIKKGFAFLSLLFVFSVLVKAQDTDRILLTIGDKKIGAEEFWSIYQKNKQINEQSEKTSLSEYLDLFINFKLKVIEAQNEFLDTSKVFKSELAGYRKQLAKPYLVIDSVNEEVMQEAYQRMQTDLRASHILFRVDANAAPEDTLVVYEKALKLRKEILAGEYTFDGAAVRFSEDPSARNMDMGNGRGVRPGNRGDLGYFSAFDMVFPFENAAYKLKKGEISMPVRTRFGYHLIYLTDSIPAIGEAKAAHIYIRNSNETSPVDSAKMRIDELYQQLQNGKAFEDLVLQSDDKGTNEKGGELPWFKANRMVPEFVHAVATMEIGEVSKPIHTAYGWHIVKFLDKRPVKSFAEVKDDIKDKLKRDVRSHKGEQAKIAQVKKEENFKEYPQNLDEIIGRIDSNFYKKEFNIESLSAYQKPLFTLRVTNFSQYDFLKYAFPRRGNSMQANYKSILHDLYDSYVGQSTLGFEEEHLEDKYPDFRMIMNEYREGILLFDIMNREVWAKAASDSVGMQQFFAQNRNKYCWGKRAVLQVYTILDTAYANRIFNQVSEGKTLNEIKTSIQNDSINPVRIETQTVEKGMLPQYDALKWKEGAVYRLKNDKGQTMSVVKITALLKPENKELSETRGLVMADYQSQLEKFWLEALKNRYPVRVNKKVLKALKKQDKHAQ